jgi:hypothetical protein
MIGQLLEKLTDKLFGFAELQAKAMRIELPRGHPYGPVAGMMCLLILVVDALLLLGFIAWWHWG